MANKFNTHRFIQSQLQIDASLTGVKQQRFHGKKLFEANPAEYRNPYKRKTSRGATFAAAYGTSKEPMFKEAFLKTRTVTELKTLVETNDVIVKGNGKGGRVLKGDMVASLCSLTK